MRIISGRFRGRSLAAHDAPGMRPAMGRVREALFSMLASRGLDFAGCRVLDLFAGSGAVGLEAVSRGAATAVFVESNPAVARVLRRNLEGLGLAPHEARVVGGSVEVFLKKQRGEVFDLVLIDPPYGRGLVGPTLAGLVAGGFVAEGGLIVAETETALELDEKDAPEGTSLLADRLYGQTRIYLWRRETPAWQSTPEPSIP